RKSASPLSRRYRPASLWRFAARQRCLEDFRTECRFDHVAQIRLARQFLSTIDCETLPGDERAFRPHQEADARCHFMRFPRAPERNALDKPPHDLIVAEICPLGGFGTC